MCGIVGLLGSEAAAQESFLGLTTLQHRGQDAAGILTHDAQGFHQVRALGLVEAAFSRESMHKLPGRIALGHTRYSTAGRGELSEVQPFLLNYPFGIGMVHNGNIVNTEELSQELRTKARRHLFSQSDSEILINLFALGLERAGDGALTFEAVCVAAQEIVTRAKGSYSLLILIAEFGLVALRDPSGIRPLVLGSRLGKDGRKEWMCASESVALEFNGYRKERDVLPGEVLWISASHELQSRVLRRREPRPCMFEWVYFASPESVLDGVPVYGARIELGRKLAQRVRSVLIEKKLDIDLVVPVPETSRIAAIALSEELKKPYREVLIKNRYIKRTFILDSDDKRKSAVNLKLSPVRSEIEGKRILLVDDSIVRGTTSKKLVELVRGAGAREVVFVSTCPPIRFGCYYGIDFPSQQELIAHERSHAQIEKELGADAVVYLDLPGLEQTLGVHRPCMACLTGNYPTDVSQARRMTEKRRIDREGQAP
jgi:amidophosphoribosyltransferase